MREPDKDKLKATIDQFRDATRTLVVAAEVQSRGVNMELLENTERLIYKHAADVASAAVDVAPSLKDDARRDRPTWMVAEDWWSGRDKDKHTSLLKAYGIFFGFSF